MRDILRGFGLKMAVVTRKGFEARVREPSASQEMLERMTGAMLEARAELWREFELLHREMLRIPHLKPDFDPRTCLLRAGVVARDCSFPWPREKHFLRRSIKAILLVFRTKRHFL